MDTILTWFGFLGTAVFAISGALLGLRKSMDIIGISFVATLTGVG
ncbi:MAG: TRIC cation channel family protein, partial [Robiginitomaculum sp.]|nr:TRIC cation channel family protein [Robiginitomaculum sp.]